MPNSFSYELTASYEQHQQSQNLADDALRRAQSRLTGTLERYRITHTAWTDWENTGQLNLQQQGDELRRLWESGELSSTDYLVQVTQTINSQDSALDLRRALWLAWFDTISASNLIDQWLGS